MVRDVEEIKQQPLHKLKTMKAIGLLFPHQLFEEHPILEKCSQLYLIEEHLFFREFNFHKQKLAFHRASMKHYAEKLGKRGIELRYIDSAQVESDIPQLLKTLKNDEVEVHYINPTDNWLEKRIAASVNENNLKTIEYENPLFINSREDLKSFFRSDKKSFFQTTFYKQQRKQRGILLDAKGEPQGGKWSFDIDNRKKFPRNQIPPPHPFPESDQHWPEAVAYVKENFRDNPGELSQEPLYAYGRAQALIWLNDFLHQRFHHFGDYEDAITREHDILHHSVLTPMLNTGLLTPGEVLTQAINFAQQNDTPINSTEGFVRQIIGWREFIRGMYECKGSYSRNQNFWGINRKIPNSFYTGTTGIEPIDNTIKRVLKTGYCHHIERLMVLGNFMLLCEFHPNDVYRWFMELFIDAYDWVMVPNIYGMSQFADGGTFATKPYISGSNYICKMSDYSKGEWQEVWDGLFWRFMDLHRGFFLKNPRLSMLVRTFDKMDGPKQEQHLLKANVFLKHLGNP